jgi:hypothetical protein
VRPLNSLALAIVAVLVLAGCSTTIDLYQYKDVSSVVIVDEDKANYKVHKPRLSSKIITTGNGWNGYADAMREVFLARNDRSSIFSISEENAYTLWLTLQNLESTKKFYPPEFIQTKKGGYYTDPHWSYTVSSVVNAELTSPAGEKRFFESSDRFSYSENGRYPHAVQRERYLQSLRNSVEKLLRQIANHVAPDGLVISKKVSLKDPDDFIFMTNMGSANGLRPEQKVVLYKEVIQKNEIDARTLSTRLRIGTATVSDQVTPDHAWIVMDDSDHNPLIEVGDIVRAEY